MTFLQILLEDGPVLAVNKPAGILTQGPPQAEVTLARLVKAFLKERDQKPGNVYLGIPHRLDRAVSGVVLFAKNSKAASRLAEQFRDRQVKKTYWAVVAHAPDPPAGSLVDWLEKVPDQPKSRVVAEYQATAREAVLQYRTLQQLASGWLVEVELCTGRFHQIRVQLAHRGWHVLGDRLYGADRDWDCELVAPASRRCGQAGRPAHLEERPIALHARSLRFLHPIRYDLVTVHAPLPGYWRTLGIEDTLA